MVHVTSLLCEVGMMAIYITSSIALRGSSSSSDTSGMAPASASDRVNMLLLSYIWLFAC